MKPTQTGIATALALAVIVYAFFFGGMSFFESPAAPSEAGNLTNSPDSSIPMPGSAPITELIVQDSVVGTGAAAAPGDEVTVHYVGTLTTGAIFDASANHPETANGFSFTLGAGQVIAGWDRGIVGMKVGGKRTLIIPASLAYGNRAVGNVIPANSDLIFQVELLNVKKGQ